MNNNYPTPVEELLKEEFGFNKPNQEPVLDAQTKPVKKEKTENKNNTVYALDIPGVIDVLDTGKNLVYLTEDFKEVDSIVYLDQVFTPPPRESCPYFLAGSDEVMEYIKKHDSVNCAEDENLYADLFTYHTEISDLPHEYFYHLLTLWDFHTYLLDKLHFSPILYLYAVKE